VAEETQKGDPDALVIADVPKNDVIEDNTVYDLVAIQEQPGFPGGDGELFNFLRKNTVYPQVEKENGIQGKVFVTFVVDKDGSVTDVQLYKGLKGGPGCDKEALRVAKMMPKWAPGKQNGKSVKVRYILPFVFKLQ
ncbi:MAG TPA: energy transducer TonB, partial [Bacteroidia bacterium]